MIDYSLIRELGEGSLGRVGLFRKKDDCSLVAIKRVGLTGLTEKQTIDALNQIRLLATVESQYVIGYRDAFFDKENNVLCIVLEYADGGDLQQLIQERIESEQAIGFKTDFIRYVATEMFRGLQYLHTNNIAHRDVKASNIYFCQDQLKFGDLNVSKFIDKKGCKTHIGTPYNIAPEVWKGKKYDTKCDIWSAGCVLYELCTLRQPFKAQTYPGIFRKILRGDYEPLESSYYPHQLLQLIERCLTVDQRLRPTAKQILDSEFLNLPSSLSELRSFVSLECPKVVKYLTSTLQLTPRPMKKKTGLESGIKVKSISSVCLKEKSKIKFKTKASDEREPVSQTSKINRRTVKFKENIQSEARMSQKVLSLVKGKSVGSSRSGSRSCKSLRKKDSNRADSARKLKPYQVQHQN